MTSSPCALARHHARIPQVIDFSLLWLRRFMDSFDAVLLLQSPSRIGVAAISKERNMKTDRERWADQYFTQQRDMEDQLNQEAVKRLTGQSLLSLPWANSRA